MAEPFDVEDRAWSAVTQMRAEGGGWDSVAYRRAMHAHGLHVWSRHLRWCYRSWLMTAAPTWLWGASGGVAGAVVGVLLGTVIFR